MPSSFEATFSSFPQYRSARPCWQQGWPFPNCETSTVGRSSRGAMDVASMLHHDVQGSWQQCPDLQTACPRPTCSTRVVPAEENRPAPFWGALAGGTPGELTGHPLIATGPTQRTAAGHGFSPHWAFLPPPVMALTALPVATARPAGGRRWLSLGCRSRLRVPLRSARLGPSVVVGSAGRGPAGWLSLGWRSGLPRAPPVGAA